MANARPGPVAGIVLAAGMSSRMGLNKLFLVLEGETIVARAVGQAAAGGLDPVIVVLGHEAERIRAELASLPCRTVMNPDYQGGLNLSLRAGIAAVPVEAAAAVIALADMPFVTADMFAALVTRYRETAALLVVSDYGGTHAPPTLFDRLLFPELAGLQGESCSRDVVRRHLAEAAIVAWPAAALTDVDFPEDYDRVKMLLATG